MKVVTSDDLRITNEEACHMIGLYNPERARQPYLVLQITYLLVTALQMANIAVTEKIIKCFLETFTGFFTTRVISDLGPWKNVEYFDTNFLQGPKSLIPLVVKNPVNVSRKHLQDFSLLE